MNEQKCFDVLEISSDQMGRPSVIYPTLIWDNARVILVDAGFPGQLPLFRQAFEKVGASIDQLEAVILTHHDIDHIGGLPAILKELPGQVTVIAHQDEKPYIEGEKVPLKLAQMEANLDKLPEDRKAFYERFKTGFANSKVPVDETLTDGDVLPYCGGITVIFTPGHTLGHICLYIQQSKTLIAGDALRVESGALNATPAAINHDMDLYRNSLKKLAGYDIETVITYHGGLYQGNASQRIRQLVEAG